MINNKFLVNNRYLIKRQGEFHFLSCVEKYNNPAPCSSLSFLHMVFGTGIMSMAYSFKVKNNSEITYSLHSSKNSCSVSYPTTGNCKHKLCILSEECPLQEMVELGRRLYNHNDLMIIPLVSIYSIINIFYIINI